MRSLRSPVVEEKNRVSFELNLKTKSTVVCFLSGDLLINADLHVGELVAETISGIDVEKLLTTSTDQEIPSDMRFNQIVAGHIVGDNINGIDFSEQAANTRNGRVVTGPVSIRNVTVLEKLFVTENVNGNVQKFPKRDNFHQFYEGRVRIVGNVVVKNLEVPEECRMFHGDEPLRIEDLRSIFWLRGTEQLVPNSVTFRDVDVSELSARRVNGFGVEKYVKTTAEIVDLGEMFFDQLTVFGNVTTNVAKQGESLLRRLVEETVRKTGRYFFLLIFLMLVALAGFQIW